MVLMPVLLLLVPHEPVPLLLGQVLNGLLKLELLLHPVPRQNKHIQYSVQ